MRSAGDFLKWSALRSAAGPELEQQKLRLGEEKSKYINNTKNRTIMSKKQAEAQMAATVVNLREKLMNLPKVMQEAVANYFNMYNCAAWLYNEILTPDAKDYVDQSIQYARELNDLEALPDTIDPQEQEQQVHDLNVKKHGK